MRLDIEALGCCSSVLRSSDPHWPQAGQENDSHGSPARSADRRVKEKSGSNTFLRAKNGVLTQSATRLVLLTSFAQVGGQHAPVSCAPRHRRAARRRIAPRVP